MTDLPGNSDGALIAQLSDSLSAGLSELVPADTPVALVDFPNHNNVGDTAIWLGERTLINTIHAKLQYTCDQASYDRDKLRGKLPREGVILLHGGGNFGDIWPDRQAFRERVVGDFPEHRVVQMPQTVDFLDPARAAVTARIFSHHGGVSMMVRDVESAETYNCLFDGCPPARVVPDAVFALGPLPRKSRPEIDVLWIRRSDHEAVRNGEDWVTNFPGSSLQVVDWFDAFNTSGTYRRAAVRFRESAGRQMASTPAYRRLSAPWRGAFGPLANARFSRGVGLLERGQVVITDRLHGHILCLLLGIPHVLRDNQHRKIDRFRSSFTGSSALAHASKSDADAVEIATTLARSAKGVL